MRKTGEHRRGTALEGDQNRRVNWGLVLLPGSWAEKCCDTIWVGQCSRPSVELLKEGWNHKTAKKKVISKEIKCLSPYLHLPTVSLQVGFWSPGNLRLGSLPKSSFWGLKRCLLLIYLNSPPQWVFLFPAIPALGNCLFFHLTWGKEKSVAKKKRKKPQKREN